jgi:hypothetical protein
MLIPVCPHDGEAGSVLSYAYQLRLLVTQQTASDEAIRSTPFIRNTAVRLRCDCGWMGGVLAPTTSRCCVVVLLQTSALPRG